MTVASVSIVGNRVNACENITGVSSIGGGSGASAEPSFAYQDTNLINRKCVSSSGSGFAYTGGSETFTGTSKAIIRKVAITDFAGLNTAFGDRARIGSSSSDYATFVCAGSNSTIPSWNIFKPRNGITIKAIDPSIVGYRESVNGSPSWSAVDYYGTVAAFATASAKSENVGIDAIDVMVGLTIINGGGADPKADYQDVFDFDEGTKNNRYGMFFEYVPDTFGQHGTLQKGSSANAVIFEDLLSTIFYPDSMTATGYTKCLDNIENASSVITDRASHKGLGNTTVTDTRPVFEVVGTSGSATLGRTISNASSVDYTSAVTVDGEKITDSGLVTQNDSTITELTVNDGTDSFDVKIDDISKVTKLTTNGSVDLTSLTATTMTLNGVVADNVTVNNASDVTINVGAGSVISTATNTGAGNVTLVAGLKSFTFNVIPSITGYEWRVYVDSGVDGELGTTELDGEEVSTASGQSYSYSYTVDTDIVVQILANGYVESNNYYTLGNNDQVVNITLIKETN